MSMTAGLDCGPVFATDEVELAVDETAGSLTEKLAKMGGKLLVARLDDIVEQNIQAAPQDESRATYAGKIKKQDACLDWSQDAEQLQRRVRAYNPAPGAFFFTDIDTQDGTGALRVKCWRAETRSHIDALPGSVVASSADGIDVACASGVLRLLELQLPGKRPVKAREFAEQLDLAGRVLG